MSSSICCYSRRLFSSANKNLHVCFLLHTKCIVVGVVDLHRLRCRHWEMNILTRRHQWSCNLVNKFPPQRLLSHMYRQCGKESRSLDTQSLKRWFQAICHASSPVGSSFICNASFWCGQLPQTRGMVNSACKWYSQKERSYQWRQSVTQASTYVYSVVPLTTKWECPCLFTCWAQKYHRYPRNVAGSK